VLSALHARARPAFASPPGPCCALTSRAHNTQDERKQGKLSSHPPHLTIQRRAPSDAVIGSQPVSLDRENMALLERKR
jgi:hypothetical protein